MPLIQTHYYMIPGTAAIVNCIAQPSVTPTPYSAKRSIGHIGNPVSHSSNLTSGLTFGNRSTILVRLSAARAMARTRNGYSV